MLLVVPHRGSRCVTFLGLPPLYSRHQRKGSTMLGTLLVIALLLLVFGVIGGIAISKFLFFLLIVAAVLFLFGALTRRSA